MTFRVVRSTELDGVTIKDADKDIERDRAVDKRIGLVLHYPMDVNELEVGGRMILGNYDEDYGVTTSSINDIDVTKDQEIAVTTRNTIYFLKEGEM